MSGGSFATWSNMTKEVSSHSPRELGDTSYLIANDIGTIFFDDYTSKGWLRVLDKDIPGGNTGKRQGKDLHTIQRRQRICNYKFSKVNALRKGWSGASHLEEVCLKCSQAEGNIKAVLINTN